MLTLTWRETILKGTAVKRCGYLLADQGMLCQTEGRQSRHGIHLTEVLKTSDKTINTVQVKLKG